MIFNNQDHKNLLLSFSFPFSAVNDVELEQPMFGANYLKGKVRAQPNGGWVGEAKFKLHFKHGGAIEYGQALLQAAAIVKRHSPFPQDPPPYQAPSGPWHQAPPPAYAAPNGGYFGWAPPTSYFPQTPPVDSVYMTDMPPPYPGLNSAPGGYPSAPYNDVKAAEAAGNTTAYYDPNRPNHAYLPPPAYGFTDAPPSYEDTKTKKFN